MRITPSKEPEMIVGEAANLVLAFIKEKMNLHENNLRRMKEREEEIIAAEKLKLPPPEPFYPEEDKFSMFKDLSVFVYDLETVEMLAGIYNDAHNKGNKKKAGETEEEGPRPSSIRKPKELTMGSVGGMEPVPGIADIDVANEDDASIRALIKKHALNEEQLQNLINETRNHLKDFSFLLLDRIADRRKVELIALREKMKNEEEAMIRAAERAARLKVIEDVRLAEELAKKEAEEAAMSRPGSRSHRPSSASGRPSSAGSRPNSAGSRPTSASKLKRQKTAAALEAASKKEDELVDIPEDIPAEDSERVKLRKARLEVLMDDVSSIATGEVSGMLGSPLTASFKYDSSKDPKPKVDAFEEDASEISDGLLKAKEDNVNIESQGLSEIFVSGTLDIGPADPTTGELYDVQTVAICDDLIEVAMFCGFSKLNINDLDARTVGIGMMNAARSLGHDRIDTNNLDIEENRIRKEATEKGLSAAVFDVLGPEYRAGNTVEEMTGFIEGVPPNSVLQRAETSLDQVEKPAVEIDQMPSINAAAVGEAVASDKVVEPAEAAQKDPKTSIVVDSSKVDRVVGDDGEMDDEWLTKGFFISVSNDSVDSIYQSTNRPFLPALEARGIRSIEETKMEALAYHERNKIESFTPFGHQLKNSIDEEHTMWLEKQLLGEVLKFQLQQEALRNFFTSRDANGGRDGDISKDKNKVRICSSISDVLIVELTVVRAVISDLPTSISRISQPVSSSYTLRLLYDKWTCSIVSSVSPGDRIVWDCCEITCVGDLTMEAIRRGKELRVELHDNSALATTLVATGSCLLNSLINSGIGVDHSLAVMLLQPDRHPNPEEAAVRTHPRPLGTLKLTLRADEPVQVEGPSFDPLELRREHVSTVGVPLPQTVEESLVDPDVEPNASDEYSDNYGEPSIGDKLLDFSNLVAALRGDGTGYVKMLIGDVTMEEISKLSYGAGKIKNVVRKLPNIKRMRKFMEAKRAFQERAVKYLHAEIEGLYSTVESELAAKYEASEVLLKSVQEKYADHAKQVDDVQADLKDIQDRLKVVRNPSPKPTDPYPDPIPEPLYVQELPKTGGLNEKGKKKKDLKKADFKSILEDIKNGDMDGQPWDPVFAGNERWPGTTQAQQIMSARQARNKVLDDEKVAEGIKRDRAQEVFRAELVKWDLADRIRQRDYEQTKKNSRKVFLRYDCASDRANRTKTELMNQENEVNSWKKFIEMHNLSKSRYRINKAKQMVEYENLMQVIHKMKIKLLAFLDARKKAFELPKGALSEVHFEHLKQMAELSLRTLRFEIVECRQQIQHTGAMLRSLFIEELGCAHSEWTRIRMLRDTVTQRAFIDKIMERHKYDAHNLLKDIEKLKLLEAEKDDLGLIGTINDAGEQYTLDRKWTNQDINAALRALELVSAKIALTEGVRATAADSQNNIMENMGVRWNTEEALTEDSWTNSCDAVRSRQIRDEALKWVSSQRDKIMEERHRLQSQEAELRAEMSAIKHLLDSNNFCFEVETSHMKNTTGEVIAAVRNRMVRLDEESKHRITSLEKNITELSRECQQIREEKNQLAYELGGRLDTLMAFILTLQTTLERMSSSVDIMAEERDEAVLSSRLEVDRMRHELRMERKHCSNLLFIIHGQRATIQRFLDVKQADADAQKAREQKHIDEKKRLRIQNWEQLFAFARMCTDVDDLFEFFATRLSNLAGCRKSINDAMRRNGAAVVLAAMCRSPRALIRKCAARSLAGMGWDGFVETRVMMWDSVLQWKLYKERVLAGELTFYDPAKEYFIKTGKIEAVLEIPSVNEEFAPSGNMSIRTIIKQRRQWALRAAKRQEGPNMENLKLLNVHDHVVQELTRLCRKDGDNDWEIIRNAALALSVASFEEKNHNDMARDQACVDLLIDLCCHEDPEIQTHAAITIANLCYNNEDAQSIFGDSGAFKSLLHMCTVPIADVLEACTAALANITCNSDSNCLLFMQAGGVETVVYLVTQSYSENLLDLNQNDELQANASEILANISRFNCELTIQQFNPHVINSLIYMCASSNKQVKRHAPLVLGNISQAQECRVLIGDGGGIEALFLAVEDEDLSVQANSLWAMCNLMWHPPNQERAGRFMQEIIAFLHATWMPIKAHAAILLANVLYYSNVNRIRFLETDGAIELLLKLVRSRADQTVVEGCLRALLSLSYIDDVALWLGSEKEGHMIPTLISFLQQPFLSHDSIRYSLETLCNLCIHHDNRKMILNYNGIDRCVSLLGDDDPHVVETARQIVTHLEDVTPMEVMSAAKSRIALDRLVGLARVEDPLVRALAAETMGEEVWRNTAKQKELSRLGGVTALVAIIAKQAEAITSVLPALWSLRNLMHKNIDGQDQFYEGDGMKALVSILSRCFQGEFCEQSEKILEGCLGCMVSAISSHERNSRRLLATGMAAVLDLAEGTLSSKIGASKEVTLAMRGEGVMALAKNILELLGPYNYVVCRHCGKKQNLTGTNCMLCGRILLVDNFSESTTESAAGGLTKKTLTEKKTLYASGLLSSGKRVMK